MLLQSITYAAFTENQEEPELLPNEVAYHLGELLGCPHHVAHRALTKTNPQIEFNAYGDAMLPCEAAGPVAAEVASILWADAVAYGQDMKESLTFRKVLLRPGSGDFPCESALTC